MATYSSNETLKYGGTIGGGATVPTNSYAIGTYTLSTFSANPLPNTIVTAPGVFVAQFQSGANVPSSINVAVAQTSAGVVISANYSLFSAFYLTNSP